MARVRCSSSSSESRRCWWTLLAEVLLIEPQERESSGCSRLEREYDQRGNVESCRRMRRIEGWEGE